MPMATWMHRPIYGSAERLRAEFSPAKAASKQLDRRELPGRPLPFRTDAQRLCRN